MASARLFLRAVSLPLYIAALGCNKKQEIFMSIELVLFDLDGTLLPLDQDVFVKAYFSALAKNMAEHGYDPDKLIKAVWSGTLDMIRNNGEGTNEEVFWEGEKEIFGDGIIEDKPLFAEFYEKDFDKVKDVCGYNENARAAVERIKAMGLRVALATNPVFPAVATEHRMAWAGFTPADFELYTTYENSRYCKPNPLYYGEICGKLSVEPSRCLMVGNDVSDDMSAEELGMKVFLLTDCLINKGDADISRYPRGSFTELIEYIEALMTLR